MFGQTDGISHGNEQISAWELLPLAGFVLENHPLVYWALGAWSRRLSLECGPGPWTAPSLVR